VINTNLGYLLSCTVSELWSNFC